MGRRRGSGSTPRLRCTAAWGGQVVEGEEKRNTMNSWNQSKGKQNTALDVRSKVKRSENIYDLRLLLVFDPLSSGS